MRQQHHRRSLLQYTVIKSIDKYHNKNMRVNFIKICQQPHNNPSLSILQLNAEGFPNTRKKLFQVRINYTFIIYSILSIHLIWNNQDTYANLKWTYCNFLDALKEGQYNIFIPGLLFFPGSPFTSRKILVLLFCIITCPAQ